jgi:hypothetical protein
MANYLLLYNGGRMPEGEAEQAKVMEAWTNWFGTLGDKLVDGGNPFSGQAKKISDQGAVGEPGNGHRHTGYSVLKAGSLDEAVKLAKGCPVLDGGAEVEVYETFAVM